MIKNLAVRKEIQANKEIYAKSWSIDESELGGIKNQGDKQKAHKMHFLDMWK